MLQEIGIESYNVMISQDRGEVRPDFPLLDFGHSIVAIHLPDSIPDDGLYTVVHDPQLGRLLFFDATEEYLPVGYLPPTLQDTDALVVTPNGGKLVHIPLEKPAINRMIRTAQFDLSAAGDLSGQVHETEWGGPAAEERANFLETQPAKRAEVFDHFLGAFLNSFHLTGASLGNLENYDQSFSMDYKFVSPGYANAAGDLLFVRPRVVGDKYTGTLRLFAEHKPRKYPIEFDEATLQDDMFDIKLPSGYAVDGLPKPVQVECAYATYKSETNVADGVLHYKRTFEIKDVIVPTEKLAEVRDFLQQVAADQQSSVVLKKSSP